MDLDRVVRRYLLTDMAILERVDEYTLYCKYLGFQPQLRTKYKSRIRTENSDDSPSFSIFASNKPDREYFWKDSGGRGNAGDIFKLIMLIKGYATIRQVYEKIDVDFNLGFGSKEPPEPKIVQYLPPIDLPAHISIKSKPFGVAELAYWSKFGVDQNQLTRYRTHNVDLYWMAKEQVCGNTPVSKLCFAYQIVDRYQLYQPYAKPEVKFRQNLTDRDLHGFHQLRYESDTLVITKARKDVMCLDAHAEIKAEFVAPRSENTPIAAEYLRFLETKYKRIITLFDNDGKHRRDFYPGYTHTEIPVATGSKDPAEFREHNGPNQFIHLINELIL